MTENECFSKMVAPGQFRPGKMGNLGGVIQIHVTRACDNSCFNCTQGSNLGGKNTYISLENFEKAVASLKGYFGVLGVFGGNPAMHPKFGSLCNILQHSGFPKERTGLWCNNPLTPENAIMMKQTFNPAVSNLNVHLDHKAYKMFKDFWRECNPVGLTTDSRHSPCYVAMKDVGVEESKRWELISNCDINQHWSAMIAEFRGELRAWFCEIAGAQSILHQFEPDYPDTGVDPTVKHQLTHTGDGLQWWECGMHYFANQVRKHCHECGVPLRGHGELAQAEEGIEQCSETHKSVYKPKRVRTVEYVTELVQLGTPLQRTTAYLQNAKV